MSGDPGERHARLVHFLANGCTKLTRALIGKLVENAKPTDAVGANKPWTLDDFLFERQIQLTTKNKARHKKLFPGRHEETKIEEWDLSLLCFVVLNCAEHWLIKQDIKQLLSIRNKVCHSANATIEKEQFNHFIKIIEVVVERCCEFIDKREFTLEMQEFLDKCKKENIEGYNEDLKVVQEWCESDPVAELNRKVDGLSNDHEKMFDKLDEMISLLKTNGISGVTLPDTNVELIVKNCSREKEAVISEYLVKLLTPKMSKDLPNLSRADKEKVMEAVKEAMSELLKGDREIVKIYHACVNLRIRCTSFDSLRDLWICCIDGSLTKAFGALQEHLRVFSECPELELDVGITHFEFNRCLEATVMEIAKSVNTFTGQEAANDERPDSTVGTNNLINADVAYTTDASVEATRSEDGSVVVLNVQPSSFNQAENIWEVCRSGAFNEKLKGLSSVLQDVYGYEDLSISARLENDSPYDSVFQYRNTRLQSLEYVKETPCEQGQSTQELETDEDSLGETELPFIDNKTPLESRIDDLVDKHREFQEKLKTLDTKMNRLVNKKNEVEQAESMLKDLEMVTSLQRKGVLNSMLTTQMMSTRLQIKENNDDIQSVEVEIRTVREKISNLVKTIQALLKSIMPDVKRMVKRAQTELVKQYAEFAASEFPDMISSTCSNVGYVLYELKTSDINRWTQLDTGSTDILTDSKNDSIYRRMKTFVNTTYEDLMQSTFVVTDQSDYCIKLHKAQLPNVTLRLLAGDLLDLRAVEVRTILLPENHDAFRGNVLYSDISDYIKLKTEKKMITRLKDEKFVINCGQLDLEAEDFERLKRHYSSSSFFKHLYRYVFFISIDGKEYSTMSLPMVVINDPGERCCALGSIMWNCFDKDVFALPIDQNQSWPWTKVAALLETRFSRLAPERQLSNENLQHLKRRLTGSTEVKEDEKISLSKFCYEPLGGGCKFSFWKWVLANYNLIDKYLKPYWGEGLIAGFLSRLDVEAMFKSSPGLKSGTFILRFSDNHITDSVGTRSVFGILTAMVVVKTEVKEGASTRIQPRYEAIEVGNHDKLRKTPLANILKDSLDKRHVNNIYRYLYPGSKKREETFDKHCLTDRNLSGYITQQDTFIVELEQGMIALSNQSRGRRNSDSSDSADSGLSSSPSETRSTSPSRDELVPSIYHRADSLVHIPIEMTSPTTPGSELSPLSVFPVSGGGVMLEGEEFERENEAETRDVIENVIERLKSLLKSSPDQFDSALKFLLTFVPKEVLKQTLENWQTS